MSDHAAIIVLDSVIQHIEPEIIAALIRVTPQISEILHQHKRFVVFRALETLVFGNLPDNYAAPDGREIFYTKARGVTGLWRVGIEGGEETPVPELAEAGYWRYWAVTRAGIYFVTGASSSLYHIKFYDFERKQVSEKATTDKPPIWIYPGLSVSADGKTILYAQQAQSASSILLAELEK